MKRVHGAIGALFVVAILAGPAAGEPTEPGAVPGLEETSGNPQQPQGSEAPPAIEKVEVPEAVIDREMKGPETTVDQWREDIEKMRENPGGK